METTLIESSLQLDGNAISYIVSRKLRDEYPDKCVLGGQSGSFDLDEFAETKKCQLSIDDTVFPQFEASWWGHDYGLVLSPKQTAADVEWQGHRLTVLRMSWSSGMCSTSYEWVIADTEEVARGFYTAVCAASDIVDGYIYIFQSGSWDKSRALYAAIKNATFESLVLPAALKDELKRDFANFFETKEIYERYKLPWKRGILLVGTPGNGKTHTVKALLNWLDKPCLYVKSFKSGHIDDHYNISSVFALARRAAPCVLVLEDLDSLINDQNRSFFLNELDGFEKNTGILVVATTNHPDRLDAAIVNRPSRFDRKYHFELPATTERAAYLAKWSTGLELDMRLDDSGIQEIAAETHGFSFAYLKELCLASVMRWISDITESPSVMPRMIDIIMAQTTALREQMSTSMESAGGNESFTVDETDE
ncbi:MAG TPA: ATP-binding protein [Capsulimonadaceae bacterium]|jgi:AAA+ superfamily predicted ATPase